MTPGSMYREKEAFFNLSVSTKDVSKMVIFLRPASVESVFGDTRQMPYFRLISNNGFSKEQLMYFQELLQQENMKKKEIEAGIKEMSSLQLMLEGSATAKVEVTGEVFGGTRICISDVSMVTKNSMKYCKFIKQQGDVKMVAL